MQKSSLLKFKKGFKLVNNNVFVQTSLIKF